jgi:hypothetical protein
MHYRLAAPADSHAAAILKTVIDALKHDSNMQRDLQRLDKACCGPNSLVQLLGAPIPSLAATK